MGIRFAIIEHLGGNTKLQGSKRAAGEDDEGERGVVESAADGTESIEEPTAVVTPKRRKKNVETLKKSSSKAADPKSMADHDVEKKIEQVVKKSAEP